MKTNQSVTITPPEGHIMEISGDKITFIPQSKPELHRVRSFEGLSDKFGYARITYWPTKHLGNAAVELGKLLQIRKQWIKDWEPDWKSVDNLKYCICAIEDIVSTDWFQYHQYVLSFPTKEMATDFLETFKSELEIAKPLL